MNQIIKILSVIGAFSATYSLALLFEAHVHPVIAIAGAVYVMLRIVSNRNR